MPETGRLWAIGLMSGTSMDGVDAALIATDGVAAIETGPALTLPYTAALRADLRGVQGGEGPVAAVERALTDAHAEAVQRLLAEAGRAAADIDVIGFHGQTILHRPQQGRTWQIGDGARLAKATGIDVVNDFRSADVAAGGQGAPLAPVYHRALAQALPRPLAVLNLGGVGNVTWIGEDGIGADDALLAFDTGPGNALLDDWAMQHTGTPLDRDGALARAGRVDDAVLAALLDAPYFAARPPKSLDRYDFSLAALDGLSAADGAATLVAFTAAAVAAALRHLPAPPQRWIVTGGGRHNPVLMQALATALAQPVQAVEAVGWDGDALEAQAFGYMAVRSLRGLPLTFPGTTGVAAPLPGGVLHRAGG
jgi:anhydro-N-acetylmuramic acid kinase